MKKCLSIVSKIRIYNMCVKTQHHSQCKNQLILYIVIFCGTSTLHLRNKLLQCCGNVYAVVALYMCKIVRGEWNLNQGQSRFQVHFSNYMFLAMSPPQTGLEYLSVFIKQFQDWWNCCNFLSNFTCPACTADQKSRPILPVKNSSIF